MLSTAGQFIAGYAAGSDCYGLSPAEVFVHCQISTQGEGRRIINCRNGEGESLTGTVLMVVGVIRCGVGGSAVGGRQGEKLCPVPIDNGTDLNQPAGGVQGDGGKVDGGRIWT